MQVAQDIRDALKRELDKIGVHPPVIEPEHPADLKNGDYSTNAAKFLRLIVEAMNSKTRGNLHVGDLLWARFARKTGQPTTPAEVAKFLAEAVGGSIDGVGRVEA